MTVASFLPKGDHRGAERIAGKLEADAALRREGVTDARADQVSREDRRPFGDHVAEYVKHLRLDEAIDRKRRRRPLASCSGLRRSEPARSCAAPCDPLRWCRGRDLNPHVLADSGF